MPAPYSYDFRFKAISAALRGYIALRIKVKTSLCMPLASCLSTQIFVLSKKRTAIHPSLSLTA